MSIPGVNRVFKKNICPTCYGLNFKVFDNPALREESLCQLFQIQVLANCKYHLKSFMRKDGVAEEDCETINVINLIYKNFNIK